MRSALPGDILFNATFSADANGGWIALNGKPVPFEGLPLLISIVGGSADTSAATIKLTIHDSADGSTVNAIVFEKTYTIAVSGMTSFEEIPRIMTKLGYLRATLDLTGTLDANPVAFVGFVTGDTP
jgi:hypothetical protein